MPIYHQGRKVKEVYHQGRKVKEIWHMGRRIYTSKPVEVMPTTPGLYDARDWLRATVQKYGLNYQTVTAFPFDIDSRNATTMAFMFEGCSALTTVPQSDTSRVTNMASMFNGCSALTDGNVSLTVKRKDADTFFMIRNSGLTREPFITTE